MSLLSRFTNLFRRDGLDRELDDELQFHIDARRDDLIASGMPPRAAEALARRQLGSRLHTRESSRDIKLFPWLESIVQDVRFGTRMLRKGSGITVTAVASLALAIGACTAAFSLINALILRPLPVRDPQALISLGSPSNFPDRREDQSFSFLTFDTLRTAGRPYVDLIGVTGQNYAEATFDNAPSINIRGQNVSGDTFDVLGVSSALGRMIENADDVRPTGRPVAVISYDLWSGHFGANPAVLGTWIHWSGKVVQVVGVAQKGFRGVEPGIRTDVWMPTALFNQEAFTNRGWSWLMIMGRLKPGISFAAADQALRAVAADNRKKLLVHRAANGPSDLRLTFERPLWILAMVAILVLLIAASNVANLFLARSAARTQEMALRVSIGADRRRLIQQLMIEGSMLMAAACALGLLFANAAAPAIVRMLARDEYPAWLDLHLDARTLAFVSALGGLVTLLFGLAPALRASSVSPGAALQGGRQSARAGLLRPVLAAQVGFSFTVLFLGGLLLLSFYRLTTMDLGFAREGVALFMAEGRAKPVDPNQALDEIRRLPGVRAAGMSGWALFDGSRWTSDVRVPGQPDHVAHVLAIAPGFFDAMSVRLLDGRDFRPGDEHRAIVNQSMANQLFPGQNPLGQRFDRDGEKHVLLEIVGVVRDAKYIDLRGPAPPTVYLPMKRANDLTIEIRTAGDPKYAVQALRKEIERAVPSIAIRRTTIQSTLLKYILLPERLLAALAAFFGVVTLALAALGLYGVMNFSVVRRTKEIGIRVALGARQLGVVRLIVTDVALVTIVGLALGGIGGLALARFLRALLYQVKPSDIASVLLPLASLLGVGVAAAIAPAVRAARVDPVIALRHE